MLHQKKWWISSLLNKTCLLCRADDFSKLRTHSSINQRQRLRGLRYSIFANLCVEFKVRLEKKWIVPSWVWLYLRQWRRTLERERVFPSVIDWTHTCKKQLWRRRRTTLWYQLAWLLVEIWFWDGIFERDPKYFNLLPPWSPRDIFHVLGQRLLG